MAGSLVAVASVILTMPMHVPHLPDRGGEVSATMSSVGVGGAFPVMVAARRQGVEVWCAACMGTGPNSMMVAEELGREGITVVTSDVVGDIGMKLVLVEADGFISSVVAPGVEAEQELASLQRLQLKDKDMVYVSASDLVSPAYQSALEGWLPDFPEGVSLTLALGLQIKEVDPEWLRRILPHIDLLTMNRRETDLLRAVLGRQTLHDALSEVMKPSAVIVRRDSSRGCWVTDGPNSEPVKVPAFPSQIRDTAAVGDVHTGVLCASLLQGHDPITAARRANAAGAIMVGRPGGRNVPDDRDVEALMAQDSLT